MGYAGAMGMMLMDKVAGVCGRAKEWFTSIQTDIGKLETEFLKAHNWSTRAQDQIDGLETLVRWLEGSWRMMRFGRSVGKSSTALVQSYRCLRIALYMS